MGNAYLKEKIFFEIWIASFNFMQFNVMHLLAKWRLQGKTQEYGWPSWPEVVK